MNSKGLIVAGALALAATVGAVGYYLWPGSVPQFEVHDDEGNPVSFETLFGDRDYMLIVFLLPNCPASKFASGVVQEQYQEFGDRMSFVGLVFGDQRAADKYTNDHGLTFPVYGMRDAPDPFVMHELIEVVGSAHGMGSAVYGGTVVVVDREGGIEFQLEREEVRDLPKRLGQ